MKLNTVHFVLLSILFNFAQSTVDIIKPSCKEVKIMWSKLPAPPYLYGAPMTSITSTAFIVLQGSGIYCYNTKTTPKWTKIDIKYPSDFVCDSNNHSSTFDSKTQTIYVCNETQLLSINLLSKKCQILCETLELSECTQILYANGFIHVINSYYHHDINLQTGKMREICNFQSNNICMDGGKIMTNCGTQIMARYHTKVSNKWIYGICKFSLPTNQWIIDPKLKNFDIFCRRQSSVITTHGDYVLFIGDTLTTRETLEYRQASDCILVYHIETGSFRISGIKLPRKCMLYPAMTRDVERDQLLVFGYIKQCYRDQSMLGVESMPVYLIEILTTFVCFEMLNVIGYNPERDNNNHWIMDVDIIITS